MILGLSVSTFTTAHVVLSIIGIGAGLVALGAMLLGKYDPRWTGIFLATTVLTSVTGFLFPRDQLLPSHIVGVITLAALLIACFALYARQVAGSWRWVYVASSTLALYLNVFVGVVQAFQKIPYLQSLAPTQSEPPFLVAQLAVMAAFIALGILAGRRFRLEGSRIM